MTPFAFLSLSQQRRLFRPIVVLTLLLFVIFGFLDVPLRNDLAPMGIVSLELAGTAAPALVNSWDGLARTYVAFGLGLDYLFIFFWVGSVSLGCLLARERLAPRSRLLAQIGLWLAWGQIFGGILDMVENAALFQLLLGGLAHWGGIAQACASLKFIILALGLLYALAGWIFGRS
ncbi:MAG: hypothetical protein OT477_19450 [Chloroflexi bacterium]|nr:hypothetical protein [Chloroflexota bacterium]